MSTALAVASMAMTTAAMSSTSTCGSGVSLQIPDLYLRIIVGLALLSCFAGAFIGWKEDGEPVLAFLGFLLGGCAFAMLCLILFGVYAAVMFIFTGAV